MNTVESSSTVRGLVRDEVSSIAPFDTLERDTQIETLDWIDSGAALFRTHKPATPPRHLVSYFVLVDADHVLLVDHINAGLWLPTGGHVEPDEHPQDTVRREVREELGIPATFLTQRPFFITSVETVGATAGHTDVSLWYLLKGDRCRQLEYDTSEFSAVAWYNRQTLPWNRTDPHMERFLAKLHTGGARVDRANRNNHR